MDRLKEKLRQARGVVQRSVARIEGKADALIAREDEIATQTDQAFAGHDAMLDDAGKGLDELSRALALVSNDPLQNSGGSPEVGQEATFHESHDAV